jgi:hypothetical protein
MSQTLGEQWIGRGGPVNWPSRSPDFNPLDYMALGTAKEFGLFSADQ